MTAGVSVALLSAPDADRDTVATVVAIVNRAYDEAERGMWLAPIERTTAEDVATEVARQSVAVARSDGRLVGSVFTRLLDPATGWFGALGVDPDLGGQGIGAALVAFAEAEARANGASAMQLELLVPEGGHPHTDRLAAWYRRLGYRETSIVDLAEIDPASVPLLAGPCAVSIMRRPLAGTSQPRNCSCAQDGDGASSSSARPPFGSA